MTGINTKYPNTFNEYDVFYFAFLATLVFIFSEILLYSQNLKGLRGIAHFIYLAVAKLAFINYFLIFSHTCLLGQKNYQDNFRSYLQVSEKVQNVLFSRYKLIGFALLIGVMLNIPFFLGLQFNNQVLIVLSLLLSIAVFLFILKKVFKHGINYLGVVVLAEKPGFLLPLKESNLIIASKSWLLKILIALALILLLIKAKILLMLFIAITLSAMIFGSILIAAYSFGYFISVVRAFIMGYQIEEFRVASLKVFFETNLKSLFTALSPVALVVMVSLVLFSFFPKKIGVLSHPEYNYSVLDQDGLPLLIESSFHNINIPVSINAHPGSLKKYLLMQEDRSFERQNSWFPGRSNWHGISFAMFYRFLSGGGGSNLNAQIIKNLAFVRGTPQDLQRKFYESIVSFQLSMAYTESEIFNLYTDVVSFAGGNGHRGIMAASYNIFGMPVNALNPLEVLYLVQTLKRGQSMMTKNGPIHYTQTLNNKGLIKETLIMHAERWRSQGLITRKELAALKYSDLRFVNRPITRTNVAATSRLFLESEIRRPYLSGITFQSTISTTNQMAMKNAIREFETRFKRFNREGGLYSAAVVVEVKTGKILAHHGGNGVIDLTSFGEGNPVSSLIKPFIIMELLESGLGSEEIKLFDGQISSRQTPRNSRNSYTNQYVGIDEILAKSLNAPLRNIDKITNPESIYVSLEKRITGAMDIPSDNSIKISDMTAEAVYNYPMGSRRMTLLHLTQMYQALFNNGIMIPLHALESAYSPYTLSTEFYQPEKRQIYKQETSSTVKNALRFAMQPGGTANNLTRLLPATQVFYIKTGTSHGAEHGYTALSDGKILVITWVSYGEENNGILSFNTSKTIPFGSGSRSAGVLASLIYNQIGMNLH